MRSNLSPTPFQLLDPVMQDNRTTPQLYNMMQQSADAPLLGFSYYPKRGNDGGNRPGRGRLPGRRIEARQDA